MSATDKPPSLIKRRSSNSCDESETGFDAKPEAKHESATKAVVAPPPTNEVLLNFGLVGVSCTIAQGTVHWTQTAMVRQQLASNATGIEPSFGSTVRSIHTREGFTGLYAGFSAAAVREMSYSSLRFGLYEPFKRALGAQGRESAPWQNVLAGLLAGTVAAAVASPTDLLTARMMKPGNELGLMPMARAVVSESGFFGLYRGIDTTITRAAILGGTKMGCYDTVKQQLRRWGHADGIGMVFLASTITGLATTITTSPATNARTLIMTSPPGTYGGMLSCMAAIVGSQGPLGLFRGFGAQWLRFGPYAVVQFTAWEQLRAWCGIAPI